MHLLFILLTLVSRNAFFVSAYFNTTIHSSTLHSTHPINRNLQQTNESECETPVQLDPEKGYKSVYVVGVLAIRGFDDAFAEFNATFNTYLTATAGRRFDPPIQFEMKPLNFSEIFSDVESKEVDFIYFNPSAFSCIESEYEAHSLVSQVSRRKVGGKVYDLKKFGGVIATTREDIQTVTDLKDKVIAAASISGLGSGQMQFQLMIEAGMNYLQDPKQLIFTSDQGLVVEGLLNGDFDVGFVRTDQLERTTDADGNPVDISNVRIIDPKPGLAIDGVPFPFLSSTDLFAEWNVAALTHVDPLITEEVQRALLEVQDYSDVGKVLSDCIATNGTDTCLGIIDVETLYEGPVKCSATPDVVLAAFNATSTGKYAGWTTSLSYLQLRSMQEATGFISKEPGTNIWRCIRTEELYQAITCPSGYNLKSKARVDSGCEELGLTCQEGYQCICQPCEKPYELVCVNSVLVGDRCVSLAVFLPSIIVPILVVVAVMVHLYVEHRRRQSDSMWIVNPKDLNFETPPTVIGQGTFGLVLLAEYRGTQVAVKRVVPPSSHQGGHTSVFDVMTSSHASGTLNDEADSDIEIGLHSMNPGLKSMFPGKLVRKLREAEIMDSQNVSRSKKGLFHSCKVCLGWDGNASDTALQTQLKAAFVSEIRQLARLRHPCITTVMGAVMPTRRDEPMLVMEYMVHGSLYDVLQDDSIVLKPEQMLAILQDVASGLRFLHSATPQVVHGDLKAQNVLIDANFCAKVTDFGLSGKKQLGAVGTPYWMSPELLSGEGVNTTASDVYAYGMVMYELYSGRAPYAGEVYAEVVQQICSPTIRKRPQIPLHCPAKIANLMRDCFEHDPSLRPTAEQLDLALKVELKVKERTSRLEALNKELEKANQKIASASALQLQHFACMSHEIRTPLNCIIGLSSLLEETELNPMQLESMEMIISSGKLLRQIVDDVLDYSKLESGNAQVLIQRINLQDTLNAVIHLIQTTQVTTDKNLNVITNYDPLLPEMIYSDSRRIQQILYNLLGNAIKFSPENGTVEFSVRIMAAIKTIQFRIKDYGKGIETEDFEKIFEPFRQTETGLSNTAGGTGLGLAITKKLVHAMEGRIAVDSVLGSWTEFTVDFPLQDRDARINAESLAKRMNSSMVLFVLDHNDPDAARVEAVFEYFNIEYTRFDEMRSLNQALALGTGPFVQYRDAYLCLAQEDLCDIETYEILASKVSSCLVTFGPKFSIERVTKKHWRSLVETFPSVLIDRLGRLVEELLTSHDRKGRSQSGVDERNSAWADLRILVAEDNVVNQKVMTRILNRLGITSIDLAKNGLEAVEMEAKKAYDLVLMDMQMPKMDGIAACQEINKRIPKAENDHALAKVIFVTAHVSDSFRQTCLDNGAIGYLPKPCTVEGMKEVLQHLMGSGSLFSPAYQESWNKNTVPPFQKA